MTRQGNPYDNALAESFLKTLKYEEIYRQECRDFADAQVSIERFPEKVYNQKHLDSPLGYRPPAEFERTLPVAGAAPGAESAVINME
jgi:putative transposase